jgi:hypothetical protein
MTFKVFRERVEKMMTAMDSHMTVRNMKYQYSLLRQGITDVRISGECLVAYHS